MDQLLEWGQPVDIQGLDIRLFDDWSGEALQSLKHENAIKFAWDNPRDNIDDKIEMLLNYVKPYKLRCYVLIGFWSSVQEDYDRVHHLWEKYRITPYVMPYNKKDVYQQAFSRWVNNFFFKKTDWMDFEHKRRWNKELDKIYCEGIKPYKLN